MIKPVETATAIEKKDYIVKFLKPYIFEGKEYIEIDLSGLESATTSQLSEVSKLFSTSEYITPRPEADVTFCCMMAAEIAHLPKQFFDNLPAKEGFKVRNCVQNFFQSEA